MLRFHAAVVSALVFAVSITSGSVRGVEFFVDDFEQYFDDIELQTVGGWLLVQVNNPVSVGADWTISNPRGRGNPAGADGAPSTGQFLISDNDTTPENPTGNGASHDIWSPPVETNGAATVWIHMDAVMEMNNNGKCVFDLDVSLDNGVTWVNVLRRVAPSRFEAPPLATTSNADGYYGRLDVDVSAQVAGADEFLFRMRDFEPSNDWWWAVDNLVVDDVPAPRGGQFNLIAEESFTAGIPPEWQVVSLVDPPNAGPLTWTTSDPGRRSVTRFNAGALPYQDGHSVARLGDFFAIMDSDADPDPAEDEYLITPVVDCSTATAVFLHYKEENNITGAVQEVLLSLDGGSTFEFSPLFSFNLGAGFDGGEDAVYAERVISVPAAVGESEVAFAFHYSSGGDEWWWAIDDVRITADGDFSVRNCAGRNLRVQQFDIATGSVSMSWTLLPGDEGFRVLANGAVISGASPLPATTASFTDPSPPAGSMVTYTLETITGGNVEFACSGPPITVFSCPRNLLCCVDRQTAMVTLNWTNGLNLAGDGWRITRNGLPRRTLPFTASSYSEALPAGGIYRYELQLIGGTPGQCPDLPLFCVAGVTGGDLILYETFDCYDDDAELQAAGWLIRDENMPLETSTWSIFDRARRGNPPQENGTRSLGRYIISDSDAGGGAAQNPTGSGMSHDIWTPAFDTTGRNTVWLHFDAAAQLNNNGKAVFDVDVSIDGGENWTNLFRQVAPGRSDFEPLARADIPEDFEGGPQVGNADGAYGRIHIDLSASAANRPNVRVRIRHFEPNFDWWIAVDNVIVDTSPAAGGTQTVLESEGFDDGIPGEWMIESVDDVATWTTDDPCSLSVLRSNFGLLPDATDGRSLHHFDVSFASVSGDSVCSTPASDELLVTPLLDCSQRDRVFLHFRSAILYEDGIVAEVLLSLDGGATFAAANRIFAYNGGGLVIGGEDPYYNAYVFEVPAAALQAQVAFGFHFVNPSRATSWWAIDDVRVTAEGGGPQGTPFRRGDADGNARLELTDAVRILNFLFLGTGLLNCREAADSDDNGRLELTDAIRVLNFLFIGGPARPPADPGPAVCGPDPLNSPDLTCERYESCAL